MFELSMLDSQAIAANTRWYFLTPVGARFTEYLIGQEIADGSQVTNADLERWQELKAKQELPSQKLIIELTKGREISRKRDLEKLRK